MNQIQEQAQNIITISTMTKKNIITSIQDYNKLFKMLNINVKIRNYSKLNKNDLIEYIIENESFMLFIFPENENENENEHIINAEESSEFGNFINWLEHGL